MSTARDEILGRIRTALSDVTETDPALAVAHNHQGCERETTSALNGGGDAVDVHQLLDDVRIRAVDYGSVTVAAVAVLTTLSALGFTSHASRSLRSSGRLHARPPPAP